MRRFNDRKAKRLGKAEFSTNIFSEKLFSDWMKTGKYNISFSEFTLIWESIYKLIQNEIVNNPHGIKLPFNCGEIVTQYLPKKVKATDPSSSNDLGEKINHLNIATKGKVAKIVWTRKYSSQFNPYINLFGFEQTREIGMKLNKKIQETPEIFRNSDMKTYND